ncbi:MAG: hypothetical protein IPK00_11840 [Deltaproteobacteria bacterium]|nr:hypothetical protein [Deltaproteobacteria bacterium]
MADDGRKLSYSERDRMRREGKGAGRSERPQSGHDRALEEKRSRLALAAAEELFTDEKGGQLGKALANAVREAHGTRGLAAACQAYLEKVGPPTTGELASIFLDAGEKSISVPVLDALLQQKGQGKLELEGGLKRQIRLLSEDFDDELASRAEDLLA